MIANNNDGERRTYWAEQMQLGHDVLQQVLQFEVRECGEPFASLIDAANAAKVEMQFSDSKIAGALDRIFYLRERLVGDVIAIARAMNELGWVLKIEDGFRSLEMQRQLGRKPELFDAILRKCIWENGGEIPPVELIFRRAGVLVANIPKFGTHMSGSAIDISVFRRDDGSEVWRGDPYLDMSERSPMRSLFVEAEALGNRLAITSLMEAHGFIHYPFEFWHYNKGDALGHILAGISGPARYGAVDWNPRTNKVSAVWDPTEPLNPMSVIEQEVVAAMQRASAMG